MQKRIFNIARQTAGTLFEILFLAFLLFANVSGTEQEHVSPNSHESILHASDNNQIILKDNQTRVFTGSAFQFDSLDWELPEVNFDLHIVALAKHKQFFISVFQRSAYYIFNTSSAP